MRGDRVRPRKANAGAMRKNAIAAHDDSHRTKNSLTGIASTPSFGEGTARKRRGNADEHACRHGDIRPPQELTDGDGHRGQNGSHDIAARQSLRKEQADKEREDTLAAVKNISDIIAETAEGTKLVQSVAAKLQENVDTMNQTAQSLGDNMNDLKSEISVFKTE